jgi:hypothetical protein
MTFNQINIHLPERLQDPLGYSHVHDSCTNRYSPTRNTPISIRLQPRTWQLHKSIFTYQKDSNIYQATATYMTVAQTDIHLPEIPEYSPGPSTWKCAWRQVINTWTGGVQNICTLRTKIMFTLRIWFYVLQKNLQKLTKRTVFSNDTW